jgi:hypothetical protein
MQRHSKVKLYNVFEMSAHLTEDMDIQKSKRKYGYTVNGFIHVFYIINK